MARDTPINSWNDLRSMTQSLYKIRGRYIRTRDPLPVMNYKQVEGAIPTDPYGIDHSGVETLHYPPLPPSSLSPLPPSPPFIVFGERSVTEEVTEEVTEGAQLLTLSGFIGDEVSVELDQGISEITQVDVNGVKADFVYISDTSLVFVIPDGATSGPVRLVDSGGTVINTGILEVVSGQVS